MKRLQTLPEDKIALSVLAQSVWRRLRWAAVMLVLLWLAVIWAVQIP